MSLEISFHSCWEAKKLAEDGFLVANLLHYKCSISAFACKHSILRTPPEFPSRKKKKKLESGTFRDSCVYRQFTWEIPVLSDLKYLNSGKILAFFLNKTLYLKEHSVPLFTILKCQSSILLSLPSKIV